MGQSASDADALIPNEPPDDWTAGAAQESRPAAMAPTTVDPIAK
jgi:hypothetical protein